MADIVNIYEQSLDHLLAPVRAFLHDPAVSEVMINGPYEIYIERGGLLEKTTAAFADEHALQAAARNIAQYVGKRLDPAFPSLEARLPDGSRVHIVQPPAARKGLCMAIRKFSRHKLTLRELVKSSTLTGETAEFLALTVRMARNIIVSGGTGSGKTTLLNCLSEMIPKQERIVVLEDASELQLQQEHVVPFEAQPPNRHGRGGMSIRDLFKASLRLRPDRIIVGECRGGEALDMIQAMTSGHSGSMSTCHANSPTDALNRLETMALMGGVDMPLIAVRAQLASAIDIIVQIARQGGQRRITHIAEVLPLSEQGNYRLVELYRQKEEHDPDGSKIKRRLVWTGKQPTFREELWNTNQSKSVRKTGRLWQIEDEKNV